jgi:hypothetical protein
VLGIKDWYDIARDTSSEIKGLEDIFKKRENEGILVVVAVVMLGFVVVAVGVGMLVVALVVMVVVVVEVMVVVVIFVVVVLFMVVIIFLIVVIFTVVVVCMVFVVVVVAVMFMVVVVSLRICNRMALNNSVMLIVAKNSRSSQIFSTRSSSRNKPPGCWNMKVLKHTLHYCYSFFGS